LAVLVFLRIFRCKRRPWFPRAVVRRFWYYLGVNGLIRLLIINFILVIFAGYVVYQRQIIEYLINKKPIQMSIELTVLIVALSIPCLLSIFVTFAPKDILIIG
jgi:hypothetical protein